MLNTYLHGNTYVLYNYDVCKTLTQGMGNKNEKV